jgi:hypothetical protein
MDGWMDGWMDGRMDGWIDGWMDGWMDERVVGCMETKLTPPLIPIAVFSIFLPTPSNPIFAVINQ